MHLNCGKLGITAAAGVNTATIIKNLPPGHAADDRGISSQNVPAVGCNGELHKLHVHEGKLVPDDCTEQYECHNKVETEQKTSSTEEKQYVQHVTNIHHPLVTGQGTTGPISIQGTQLYSHQPQKHSANRKW